MLPSLGFHEILLLGVLALVVVGPKDLPLLLRKLGRWTAKLRGMAQEFRTGFDELARQAELDELKKEVEALRRTTNLQQPRQRDHQAAADAGGLCRASQNRPPRRGERPRSAGGVARSVTQAGAALHLRAPRARRRPPRRREQLHRLTRPSPGARRDRGARTTTTRSKPRARRCSII